MTFGIWHASLQHVLKFKKGVESDYSNISSISSNIVLETKQIQYNLVLS